MRPLGPHHCQKRMRCVREGSHPYKARLLCLKHKRCSSSAGYAPCWRVAKANGASQGSRNLHAPDIQHIYNFNTS